MGGRGDEAVEDGLVDVKDGRLTIEDDEVRVEVGGAVVINEGSGVKDEGLVVDAGIEADVEPGVAVGM